jgi:hypothetical protein
MVWLSHGICDSCLRTSFFNSSANQASIYCHKNGAVTGAVCRLFPAQEITRQPSRQGDNTFVESRKNAVGDSTPPDDPSTVGRSSLGNTSHIFEPNCDGLPKGAVSS